MKKFYLLSFLLIAFCCSFWAQKVDESTESSFVVATQFGVTRPLSEIFAENPVREELIIKPKTSGDRKIRKPQFFEFSAEKDGPAYGNDPASVQTRMGVLKGTQVRANWAGQTASGFRPYDPSGAVGPNHYVQMINSTTFKVYNKATGAVTLTATLGNLWTPATANAGDPIVMYDKAADRWFLAQFGSGNNNIYIAISTTPDPTGSYYTYTFTSPQFPDYLKFGVWHDGYYMTSNQTTQKVFAFERTAMLAGTAGARSVIVNFTPPTGGGFFCPVPGCAADGVLPPAGTPCPIFSYSDNAWGAGISDAVKIYNMSVNWTPTTPTATITAANDVLTAAFDASYNASWNDCVQPGTTQKLDGIGGVIMYRAQWKTWPTHNSVVLNWAVNISASQRSIKWCELRQNKTTGAWSLYQEGIYTPDAATRWMGAICMDNNGSIGLSYLKSDATSIFPGLYYTGRRECDPLGTLPITEVMVVAGTGFQTGTNRNGDYAHSCLDPDGFTFWSTSEYMGGASGGSAARTRIFSYTIDGCTTDAQVTINVTSGSNPTCAGASMTFTATPYNGGTAPTYQWKVNGVNVGTNSSTYTSSSLTAGQVVTCVMTSNLAGVTANPATSNSITISVAPSVTPSVSIAQTAGTNPTCPGVAVTYTATPTNGGTAPVYQWQVNGVNAGTNSNTFTSTTLVNGSVVRCVMTSNAQCSTVASVTSNELTLSITSNSTPSVSISSNASGSICAGTQVTFTASVSGGSSPSYQWKVNGVNVGSNSNTYSSSSLTNGQVVTCQVTTAGSCPTFFNLGTGTTLNSLTSGAGAAYATYYGNGRQQYIIRATELTALGLSAGSAIGSIGFDVASATGDPLTLNGFTIKMGNTSATTATTTFQTGASTVFGPVNYTPTLNSINTHTLTTPFTWNGTSNIVVESCFSNQVVGNQAYQTRYSVIAFAASTYYQADGATGAGACTQATGTTTVNRPNMRFGVSSTGGSATSNAITISVTSSTTYFADADGDGYGNAASSIVACTQPAGYVSNSTDCNDTNNAINPSATEICNTADDDCDGLVNEGVGNTYYADTDGDGYGNAASSIVACTQPAGYVSNSTDCNDGNNAINPAATEVCNTADDDCDGLVNEGVGNTFYADTDGDGYGNAASSTVACTQPAGYVSNSTDCNDSNAAIKPGATEVCNTVDDDCDGLVNEGVGNTYYADTDGDGFGNAASSTVACTQPAGFVTNNTDCNDSNAAIKPGATEVCNTVDDDCDGLVNEGVGNTYYADTDGDGYGNAASSTVACTQPSGFVTNNTDCNDSNAAIKPGATEVCNTVDDDCDGLVNEGVGNTYYADTDGDGYGNAASSTVACTQPAGYVTSSNDCNDNSSTINPGASEVCGNSIDENCSGTADEGCCSVTSTAVASNVTCSGATNGGVNLTVTSGVAPYTFLWSNGLTTEDLSNVGIGSYSVTITAANGCQGTASATVGNNNQTQAAPTAIDGSYGVCRNSTGNVFTAPAVSGATSYQWTLPTGATGSSTTNSITLSFSATYATGNLSVRAVGPCGTSAAFSRAVYALTTVPAAPSAISGPTTNVCAGSTQTFSCTAVVAATSYQWTAPTNATIVSGQGTQTVSISFAANFAASGSVSVKSQNCFGLSAARTVTVYNIPGTPGTISGTSANVCPGTVLTYTIAAVPGASSYTWTAPANCTIASGQGTNSISLSIGAAFISGTLSVVAVSSCGQSAARTLALSKNPVTPSAMVGQTTNLCGGGQFTYSVTAVSGATSYVWTVPTGCTIATNNGNSIVLNVPSTFTTGTLSVQAVNSCGGTSTRTASLTRLPSTPASITGPASVCPNQVGVNFTTPAVTGVTQLWTAPTGAAITAGQGTTSMTCTWGAAAGSVTLRSVNTCGQSAALSKAVTLLACMEEEGGAPVEARTSDLNVYPNPNDGSFTVRSTQAGLYRLLNSTGQMMYEIQLNETNNFSFEVSGLSTGFYFLQGITGSSYVQQKVVVINR